MARYQVQSPDGQMHVIEGPDGATPEQVMAAAQANIPQAAAAAPSFMDRVATAGKQVIAGVQDPVGKNALMAVAEHAANVGATYMQPFQALQDKLAGTTGTNAATRAGIKGAIDDIGVDRNTLQYKNFGMATDMAATAGLGGLLAKPIAAAVPYLRTALPAIAPYVDKFANALGSAGFTTGGAAPANALAKTGEMGIRMAGGAVTGGASTGLIDPNSAGTGAMVGAALPPGLKALGAVAEPVGAALATGAKSTAERLMQSALKPTIAQLRSGEAKTAVQTLLDYGINPTAGGVNKLQDLVSGLNSDITAKIQGSSATVSKQNVLNALGDVRKQFGSQVNPTDDIAAINRVGEDFSAHPAFAAYRNEESRLSNNLAGATNEKQMALQASGKLQTFAAQQQSLADGATIRLSSQQPENQLYYNTGGFGRDATSPSSLPVPGYPRMPGRYTNNIDRVAEGEAGSKEALDIYKTKRAEELSASDALKAFQAGGESMPVQAAQEMKQGTYRALAKKYGQLGGAETEAQKGLARGLKDEIAAAVPGVGEMNAEESRLLATLSVTERRALMDVNKNPMGLAALAHNPLSWMAFMADRSAAFKSLAARAINSAAPAAGNVNALAAPALYRAAPRSIQNGTQP